MPAAIGDPRGPRLPVRSRIAADVPRRRARRAPAGHACAGSPSPPRRCTAATRGSMPARARATPSAGPPRCTSRSSWPDRFPRPGPRRAARRRTTRPSTTAAAAFTLAACRLAYCGGFDLEDPEVLAEAAAAAGHGPRGVPARGRRRRPRRPARGGRAAPARGRRRPPARGAGGPHADLRRGPAGRGVGLAAPPRPGPAPRNRAATLLATVRLRCRNSMRLNAGPSSDSRSPSSPSPGSALRSPPSPSPTGASAPRCGCSGTGAT